MAVAALIMFVVWFVVAFVARSIIQKRTTGDSGIRAGGLQAAAGSIEWWAGWIFVLALLAGFAAPVAEIAGYEPITTNRWLRGTGAVVAGIGIVATFLAQMNMGAEWRIGVDADEQTGLVTTGAYRAMRNPIFTAMIVAAIGLATMVPSPVAIAAIVLLVLAVELQVRFVEEPHLRRLHGDHYESYTSRVGRFIPGLGRR
jgi:protein-S-isoprenylcysteine O-methyltransferase Ste14